MRSRWRIVARFIVPVFNEFEIKEIELEEREDQPGRFLQAWIRKYRLDATREALCAALFAADLGSSAREVFPDIYENMTQVRLRLLRQLYLCHPRKRFWIPLVKFNERSSSMTKTTISWAEERAAKCTRRR